MKFVKFDKFRIQWDPHEFENSIEYTYFFSYWHWLPKECRYFGFSQTYHDGFYDSFGFWFFNWTWYAPWTRESKKL